MTPDPNLVEDLRLLEPIAAWWLWVAAAVVLLLASVFALRRWHRQHPHRPTPASQRTAFADALAALERLQRLLTPPRARPYAIASSRIVRHFIERRFGIRAPFQATEEFLVAASRSDVLAPRHRELLTDYLGRCDLLKFARHRADHSELLALHDAAVRFAKESMPVNPPKEIPNSKFQAPKEIPDSKFQAPSSTR